MRPVSTRLLNVVGSTYPMRWRARMSYVFSQDVNPASSTYLTLKSVNGGFESTADVRGTVTLELDPIHNWGSVLPDGAEVYLECGVELGGGQVEWVSYGYFGILDVTQQNAPAGGLTLTCADRMARVRESQSYYPFVAPANITLAELFQGLLYGNDVWSQSFNCVFDDALASSRNIVWLSSKGTDLLGYTIPLIENSTFEILDEICKNRKLRMWFDYRGRLTIADADVFTGDPVTTVSAGANGTLSNFSRQVTQDGVKNVFYVSSGEGVNVETPPVWSYHFPSTDDRNPNVASRRITGFDRFGIRLKRFASPLFTTQDQCKNYAIELGDREFKGLPYSASFEMFPNPGLEVLDTVNVVYPSTNSTDESMRMDQETLTESLVIDSIQFDSSGKFSVTTRGGIK